MISMNEIFMYGGDKVEERSPEHCLQWREDTCGDDGGYRVGSIVKAIEKIENESYSDEGEDKVENRHRTPSTVLEQHACDR